MFKMSHKGRETTRDVLTRKQRELLNVLFQLGGGYGSQRKAAVVLGKSEVAISRMKSRAQDRTEEYIRENEQPMLFPA